MIAQRAGAIDLNGLNVDGSTNVAAALNQVVETAIAENLTSVNKVAFTIVVLKKNLGKTVSELRVFIMKIIVGSDTGGALEVSCILPFANKIATVDGISNRGDYRSLRGKKGKVKTGEGTNELHRCLRFGEGEYACF